MRNLTHRILSTDTAGTFEAHGNISVMESQLGRRRELSGPRIKSKGHATGGHSLTRFLGYVALWQGPISDSWVILHCGESQSVEKKKIK